MTIRSLLPFAPLLMLAACEAAPPAPPAQSGEADAPAAAPPDGAVAAVAPSDGKSPEAALALTRDYYALIEARRFAEAARLVRTGDARRIEDKFGGYKRLRATAGPVGESGGAAGSLYITVPARIEASGGTGEARTIEEIVTLRRVNDVPGATEAQRRWHIEGVDAAATDDRGP